MKLNYSELFTIFELIENKRNLNDTYDLILASLRLKIIKEIELKNYKYDKVFHCFNKKKD